MLRRRLPTLLATLAVAVLCASANGSRLPERRLQREYGVRGSLSHNHRQLMNSTDTTSSRSGSMMSKSGSKGASKSKSKSKSAGKSKSAMAMSGSMMSKSSKGSMSMSNSTSVDDSFSMDDISGSIDPFEEEDSMDETTTTSTDTVFSAPEKEGTEGQTETGETRSGSCSDMAKIYDVHVDIQIDFDGSKKLCNGKWNEIKNAVTLALNDNFSSRVPDWEGTVGFSPVAFDNSETIDNTRRFLRDLQQEQDFIEAGHRRLASCPVERDIPCDRDLCLWGCLTAPTTSCGVNSLTNWHLLSEDVQKALDALYLDCLGTGSAPEVNIVVTDPDEIVTDAGSTPRGPEDSQPQLETLSAVASQLLSVKSTLTITFFGGLGALPDTSGIMAAQAAVVQFYTTEFENDPDFGPVFQQFAMQSVTPEYDFDKPDEFVLEFFSDVTIAENSALTATDAANVMAAAPFKEFITDYVRSLGGEFSRTFKIHFRGVTHAR